MTNSKALLNEKGRLNALLGYQILGTPVCREFDRLTELACLMCNVPAAMISFFDETKQFVKSFRGSELPDIETDAFLCYQAAMRNDSAVFEDSPQDIIFKTNKFPTENPNIAFYRGFPLVDPEGYILGSLCIFDSESRELTDGQVKGLELLAEQAVTLTVSHKERAERQLFEKLFELSEDLICIIDSDCYFRKINPAFVHLLGWDEPFLLDNSIQSLVHPDDQEKLTVARRELRSTESVVNFLFRFRCKNDDYLHLHWTATKEPGTNHIYAIARNVSLEKANADKLLISEINFRSFFENSLALLCTHDLEGNLLSINPTGAQMLGVTPSRIDGLNLIDLIPQMHREAMQEYLDRVGETGKATGLMTTINPLGGTVVWSYNNALVKNQNGPDYVIGNAIDVTQSHRLSKNVRRIQEMLMQTNQTARIGGWELEVSRGKVFWSDMTRIIHESELVFIPNQNIFFDFYKNESRLKLIIAMNDAISDGVPFDLELELFTTKGNELWVRMLGNSEFENGKCKRLFGTIQDIDLRKKSEQDLISERARLRAFVDHAPAAVAMFDKDIKYLAISRKWLEEYQLVGQDIIGKSHYEIFPKMSIAWRDIHQRCLAGEIVTMEEEQWRPEGWDHDQFLKWEVRPWYLFDGSIGGIMMFTQDITEAAIRKAELKEAKMQSEMANTAKSEFLANMSHEIRTPLNGVIGFTDLVLKTKMTETQRQYLGIVSQSAHSLLNVINDILDFSKIEAGKLELDVAKFDIYEIISQSADIISFLIQSKGLEMLLNIPEGLPRFIWSDEIRLKQVLINLLSNAAKFTDHGEIELKLEVLEYDPEVSTEITCRFIVRDTGIGIREEKQGQIFEAFLQEDGSTSKKYGGTGLGLTISNKLLGMMGSELQLKSLQGVGSTFYFDLRLKCEPGDPLIKDVVHEVRRVLIVDDNENNRLILEKMLHILHIESVQVSGGQQALDLLKYDRNFDVVLIDYFMPGLDGLETATQIRTLQFPEVKQLPIVLLSSSVDRSSLQKYDGNEVDYRLIKPVKLIDIMMCFTNLSGKGQDRTETADASAFDEVNEAVFSVLVAEDNPANMFLTRTIINKMAPNAVIREARNGNEAVRLCQTERPDIVFMDVQMPELNGYEATRAIKTLPGADRVPIIALTAGNIKGEREKCLEAGMVDFVTKPFAPKAIWDVLLCVPQFAKDSRTSHGDELPATPIHANFDLARLRTTYMDDDKFIEELLGLTRQALLENLSDLRSFYERRDLAGIKSTAHRLKGVARAVFITELANMALDLEMLVAFDHDLIGQRLDQLSNEIEYLLPAFFH